MMALSRMCTWVPIRLQGTSPSVTFSNVAKPQNSLCAEARSGEHGLVRDMQCHYNLHCLAFSWHLAESLLKSFVPFEPSTATSKKHNQPYEPPRVCVAIIDVKAS
jgi:hypothetical protein